MKEASCGAVSCTQVQSLYISPQGAATISAVMAVRRTEPSCFESRQKAMPLLPCGSRIPCWWPLAPLCCAWVECDVIGGRIITSMNWTGTRPFNRLGDQNCRRVEPLHTSVAISLLPIAVSLTDLGAVLALRCCN